MFSFCMRVKSCNLFMFTANAVLEGACERVIVGDLYCDIPLGLYVIRGENVVLIGELVCMTILFFSLSICEVLYVSWTRKTIFFGSK